MGVEQKMMKKVNPLFLALEMLIFVFKTYTKATRLPPLILSYFTFPQKTYDMSQYFVFSSVEQAS